MIKEVQSEFEHGIACIVGTEGCWNLEVLGGVGSAWCLGSAC